MLLHCILLESHQVVYAAITSKSHLLLEDRSPALNSKPSTQDHMCQLHGFGSETASRCVS